MEEHFIYILRDELYIPILWTETLEEVVASLLAQNRNLPYVLTDYHPTTCINLTAYCHSGGRNESHFFHHPSPSKHTLNVIGSWGRAGWNIQFKHMNKWYIKGGDIIKSTRGIQEGWQSNSSLCEMEAAQTRRERQNCGFPTLFRLTLFDKGTSIKALNLKTIFYPEKQKKPSRTTPTHTLLLPAVPNLYDTVHKSFSYCQLERANSSAGMHLLQSLTKLKTTTLCTVEQHTSSNHSTLPVILIFCYH